MISKNDKLNNCRLKIINSGKGLQESNKKKDKRYFHCFNVKIVKKIIWKMRISIGVAGLISLIMAVKFGGVAVKLV